MDATLHAQLYVCGLVWTVTVPPVVFQCRLQKLRVSPVAFQFGLFQLSFSSGVPVNPANIRLVAQWFPGVRWVNQWNSSGIPVYTGPASVHWLRVRELLTYLWINEYVKKSSLRPQHTSLSLASENAEVL